MKTSIHNTFHAFMLKLLTILCAIFLTAEVTADTVILTPTDDTSQHPGWVPAGEMGLSEWEHIFLKFVSNNVQGNVVSAKLRIYNLYSSPVAIHANAENSDNWSENDTNNLPSNNQSNQIGSAVANGTGYVEIDVTNYVATEVAGDSVVSINLKGNFDNLENDHHWNNFSSKEGANPPELIIVTAGSSNPNPHAAKIALNTSKVASHILGFYHKNFFKMVDSFVSHFNILHLNIKGTASSAGEIIVTIDGQPYITPIKNEDGSLIAAGKVAKTLYNAGFEVLGSTGATASTEVIIHIPGSQVSISSEVSGITTKKTYFKNNEKNRINFTVNRDGELLTNEGLLVAYASWPQGTYDLTWTGSGKVRVSGLDVDTIYHPNTNSATVTVHGSTDSTSSPLLKNLPYKKVSITVTGTPNNISALKRGDDLIGNIRKEAIDNVLAYGSSGARFMDLGMTNNQTLNSWNTRSLPTSVSYVRATPSLEYNKGGAYIIRTSPSAGAPWEDQVEFANACHAINPDFKPWFNLPYGTTAQQAEQIRIILDGFNGSSYNIEYSNELWNGIFSQNSLVNQHAAENGIELIQEAIQEVSIALKPFADHSTKAIPVFAWKSGSWNAENKNYFINNYAQIMDVIGAISSSPYVFFDNSQSIDYQFNGGTGAFNDPNPETNPITKVAVHLQQVVDVADELGILYDAYEGFALHPKSEVSDKSLAVALDSRYEYVQLQIMNTLMPILPSESRAYIYTSVGENEWGIIKYGSQPKHETPQSRAMQSYADQ